MSITNLWLKNAHQKHRDTVLEKTDRDGLSVRVSRKGKIVFQYRFRYHGKAARMDLGAYPVMSLKEAREEVVSRRKQLEEGHDPRVRREVEKRAVQGQHTNETLLRLWHEKYVVINKVGADEILCSFERYVFPEIGDLPADDTTTHAWMGLLESVRDASPSIASRLLTNVRQCHKWARRWGYMSQEPVANMTARADLNIHKNKDSGRAFTDRELWVVWHATERSRLAARSKLFVKLTLFFGCRPGELRTAAVSEFDFENKVWEIPPERHKTGQKTKRPLRRPLIDEVIPWIEEAMALSMNPRMLFSGESKPTELGDRSTVSFHRSILNAAERQLNAPLPGMCLYDLRKTARTNWSSLGPPHVCEVMLGHSLPGVWQVYDRYDYLEEQAEVYRRWWDRLMQIVSAKTPPTP
ncbi:DUF4102 domain-containing protein [Guyparkeria halophila]|uniref:DUF4102 domain-containing protein n=1 Tax=Guyparkeria halophila TaxID=47960 RepID=A0A6I6D3R4_9GAMM|nr:site-specific integrase [Guyparkeria halophila]QGT78887.1 DUF4102 domain-containing protein [Guyparkeria halophila]